MLSIDGLRTRDLKAQCMRGRTSVHGATIARVILSSRRHDCPHTPVIPVQCLRVRYIATDAMLVPALVFIWHPYCACAHTLAAQ